MLAEPLHFPTSFPATRLHREVLASRFLERDVELTILLPPSAATSAAPYPVLYLNDGQDLERLNFQATLDALYARGAVVPFVVVAIHANERRVQEYGAAARADFTGRGSLAGAYTNFVLQELLPFAQSTYQVSSSPAAAVMAGFSLGGLTAFDIVWHHPKAFERAGVFSGSFWWRHRAVEAGYTPADRIMHGLVRGGQAHSRHRFWLQTGTLDEHNDRNQNGVIDSIEDCLDIMEELGRSGLDIQQRIRYVQVEGGRHHPDTWGWVMPDFLVWAFGPAEEASHLPAPLPVVRLHLDPALVPSAETPGSAPANDTEPIDSTDERADDNQTAMELSEPASVSQSFPMPHSRPVEGDFLPYAGSYIDLVPLGADPLEVLRLGAQEIHGFFANLSEAQAEQAYAPGKWSLKEMLLHQVDSERIFAYRALRFARGDSQDLLGFEQDDYVTYSGANARSVASLLHEYDTTRAATLALFGSFTEEQLERRGTANGGPATVRALLYIVPGHELHHFNIIRERYLPIL